jgi:ketosteroid isomerase-like protein
MNSIRVVTAFLATTAVLAVTGNALGQSSLNVDTPQAHSEVQSDATKQQQDEVMKLMAAYLGLWSADEPGRYALEPFVNEDAVFEYRYADEAYRRIEGRTAIGQALARFSVMASNWEFSDLRLFETLYSNIFYVEYNARAYVPTTQRTYQARYVARIGVRDGKIADYEELWDLDARAFAFDLQGASVPSANNRWSGKTHGAGMANQPDAAEMPAAECVDPAHHGISLERSLLGGQS